MGRWTWCGGRRSISSVAQVPSHTLFIYEFSYFSQSLHPTHASPTPYVSSFLTSPSRFAGVNEGTTEARERLDYSTGGVSGNGAPEGGLPCPVNLEAYYRLGCKLAYPLGTFAAAVPSWYVRPRDSSEIHSSKRHLLHSDLSGPWVPGDRTPRLSSCLLSPHPFLTPLPLSLCLSGWRPLPWPHPTPPRHAAGRPSPA